jgi:hypothetical protein
MYRVLYIEIWQCGLLHNYLDVTWGGKVSVPVYLDPADTKLSSSSQVQLP